MIEHVLAAAKMAGAERNIVVIGFNAEQVRDQVGGGAEFAVQAEQLGTGHAVQQAAGLIGDFAGPVLVLCGDTPLLTGELLRRLVDKHNAAKAAATVLTAIMPDPTGYGRVIRDEAGRVRKIVEQKDALPAELAVGDGQYRYLLF